MTKIFDAPFNNLQQALTLRLKQHGLVSTNLANATTPEFEAKRIDFRAAFDKVLQGDVSGSMRMTDSRHIEASSTGRTPVVTIEAPAWSEDGNSVHAEEEMAVLASNNLLYNASVEAMNRKLGLLEYAATDGGKA